MKTACLRVIVAMAMLTGTTGVAMAEGLIHQLPPDGSWVRFDVNGEAFAADGSVSATLTGSLTVKSVGNEQIDGGDCRWIEMATALEFKKGTAQAGKQTQILKLLIPEKYLATGENPRAHVVKAWKKEVDAAATELDLTGPQAREIESLDEILHGSLAKSEQQEKVALKVPGGTFVCTQLIQSEAMPAASVELATSTWLTPEVPFGVAAYRHSKTRKRGNEMLGGRWMELKFAESGKDAKSEIVPPIGR